MTLTTILAVYFLIWWLTFFAVLPFGVRSQHEDGDFVAGTDPGAPSLHRVWRKAAYTTVIASIIAGALYYAYVNGFIPFEFLDRVSAPPPR